MKALGSSRVSVIGTGTIGASWAALFLAHGIEVFAYDIATDGQAQLEGALDRFWPVLERVGLPDTADRSRLRYLSNLEAAVDGADFVQESVKEDVDLKRSLFRDIDRVVPPSCVIASSSSGLMMSDVQIECSNPNRCVIGHPFNPPHLIPLVEVVGGRLTSVHTIEYAMEFYRAIGKHPILLQKEIAGHIANRLQAALLREAIHLVNEGVGRPEDIDASVVYGPGMRWAAVGPLLTIHLAGGNRGIEGFVDRLAVPFSAWMADLGTQGITAEVATRLIAEIQAMVGSKSVEDLEAERDSKLISIREIGN